MPTGELVLPRLAERASRPFDPRGIRFVRVGDRRELHDVPGPAGLGSATDVRPLPSTERLALHDGAGDVAVHVGVADLDALEPPVDLGGVERVDAAGEPEVGVVLELDRVVEVVGAHHAEHGPEALGAVEPRTRSHSDATRRATTVRRRRDRRGSTSQCSPGVERGQRAQQRSRRRADQRAHHGARVGRPDRPRRLAHRVGELAAGRCGLVVHRRLDDRQARRGALLAGVTERRTDEVGDRQRRGRPPAVMTSAFLPLVSAEQRAVADYQSRNIARCRAIPSAPPCRAIDG